MADTGSSFSSQVINWFDEHGRFDLPWQQNRNLYRVWLAEIMLQQTQVKTVIPYYQRFVETFPSISDLASSTLDDVLSHWAGLGYYSRARNLHKTAVMVMRCHDGEFPELYDDVLALPGIGPSTAGAILAQALNQPHAILDGNVKRVLSRYHAIEGWSGHSAVSKLLWEKARLHTPMERLADYTQAIMDLGATICVGSSPKCMACPLVKACEAFQTDSIALYPAKKQKKKLPIKQVRMLLIRDCEGAVMLEKRPPVGIWGGLWSLPEMSLNQDITEICQQRWGFKLEQFSDEPCFRHTFSHYHLDIHPSYCQIQVVKNALRSNDDVMWCKQEQLLPAVATPVAKLLSQHQSNHLTQSN